MAQIDSKENVKYGQFLVRNSRIVEHMFCFTTYTDKSAYGIFKIEKYWESDVKPAESHKVKLVPVEGQDYTFENRASYACDVFHSMSEWHVFNTIDEAKNIANKLNKDNILKN